jgi:hypothetical protein
MSETGTCMSAHLGQPELSAVLGTLCGGCLAPHVDDWHGHSARVCVVLLSGPKDITSVMLRAAPALACSHPNLFVQPKSHPVLPHHQPCTLPQNNPAGLC